MNALRRKSAVAKLTDFVSKQMTKEEAIDLLKKDEANYTEEELVEIASAYDAENVSSPGTGIKPDENQQIPNTAPPPPGAPGISNEKPEEKKPNSEKALDLSGFDYSNLTGEKFKEYVELVGDRSYRSVNEEGEEIEVVGKLKQTEMFDFQLHKVDVVRRARYRGVKDSPMDFVGVKVKSDKPEAVSRMPLSAALELNAQILNAHSIAGHGKYWLLKK